MMLTVVEVLLYLSSHVYVMSAVTFSVNSGTVNVAVTSTIRAV